MALAEHIATEPSVLWMGEGRRALPIHGLDDQVRVNTPINPLDVRE
jgi:hypothetical protein